MILIICYIIKIYIINNNKYEKNCFNNKNFKNINLIINNNIKKKYIIFKIKKNNNFNSNLKDKINNLYLHNYNNLYIYITNKYFIKKIIIETFNNKVIFYEFKNKSIFEIIFININHKNYFFIKNVYFINKNYINNNFYIYFNNFYNKIYKICYIYFYNKNDNNIIIICISMNNLYNKYRVLKIYENYFNFNLIKLNILKYNRFPIYGNLIITSYFNLRRLNPITYSKVPHKGIDISIPFYTPIFAIENGIVIKKSYNKKAGNYLIINHNNFYITKYMHLSKSFVNKSRNIKFGDLIGLSGNSGMSTGPHLHFEVWVKKKVLNPMSLKFQFNF
ncbi:peptidoglycan DD-metalloendopeptidase family protein [Candidatus Nardonella dryophthoridicola]|uniref:YebA protein n=1 Tax=endosymbiont of Rhynchophorus ferrugineus TaxID=1972133 RepID=A0A2Z5T404_9GAMM|nr:peptidoglycan DD-metalloendopeptidase family protein [Candidatus Nardonella dryophthoridicola]BBA85131.1 yebA protein [endosymbiont of Rhynchophorus ferrugineus]